MSKTKRTKRTSQPTGRLLLEKQQVSRAQLATVAGGGEISGLISGAISAIGSASSSTLETPSGVVSGAVSAAASAYDSNHWSDRLSFKW